MGGYAWVTLATNDAYSLGALVLAHSLRRVGTTHDLVCMVTPGVTSAMREKLAAVFSMVQEVNVLDSKDEANLALLARPELGITFTKLHCWRLTQYEKCVFIDADALVVRNCDELFEREELSAAPDVGWPDCFNSGVFVFRPSQQTFASITAFAAAKGSFDGGDQGLLNMYFSDWATKDISKHLPFIYNMCSTATYSYLPAFKQFGEDVRIIHFIGITKPWLQYFDTLTGTVQPPEGSGHLQPLLQLWWNIFCEQVHSQLSASMAGIAGALAQMTLGEARSAEQTALEDQMRKQSWEQGQIDYMGRDSFDNIWKKIMETLSQAPQQTPPKEDIPKAEERATTDDDKPAEQIAVSADVVPAAEPDKDPTQGQLLACKTPEEKSSAQIIVARESGDGAVIVAQPSEQPKTTTSPSEKIPAVEAVATKLSSESPQPPSATQGDFCMKPSQYVAPCEASTDVPAPQPLPMELSSVAQMSAEQQCKLVTPITQETPSQDKSESAKLEEQAAFVSLPTEQAACILQKPIAPITQTDDGAPIECKAPLQLPAADKPQIPAPVAPDVMQPAVPIAIPGAPTPVEPVQDSAKLATESKVDVTQPLAIDPGERCAEMLLAASEVSTVSPVPIQVAESVLQTEPKEAVSGAAVAARDQAIATTITAVHEPAAVAPVESETRPVQMNGSACDAEKAVGDIAAVTPAVPSSPEKPVAAIELTKEPAGDSTTTKDAPLEIPPVPSVLPITEEKIVSSSSAAPPETSSEKLAKPAEQIAETGKGEPIAQIAKTESTETKPPEQTAKTEAAEALKPTEQIAKAETIEGKPAEQVASAEITKTIAKPGTIEVPAKAEAAVIPTESTEQAPKTEAAAKSPGEVPKPPVAEQKPPSESIEAKALDIPSTPTVIEATPPTSPSVESAQEVQEGQDKTAKKSLKKSDSADGTDGEGATDKKTGKKNAKKVTKKPKSSKPEETAAPATETVAVTTAATAPTTATATVAGAGADSSQGKTKKTVKVTKKTGTKTGQSLETDTAIPETPPPPTPTSATATTVTAAPDVPVPPKRKTKTTTSGKGTTGKKSETEE